MDPLPLTSAPNVVETGPSKESFETAPPSLPNLRSAVVLADQLEETPPCAIWRQRTAMLPSHFGTDDTPKRGSMEPDESMSPCRTALLEDVRLTRTAMLPMNESQSSADTGHVDPPETEVTPPTLLRTASDIAEGLHSLIGRKIRLFRSDTV